MSTEKIIDICYYSSDFYAPYTGVSMYSLCKNNQDVDFRLSCIDTGISEENKRRMQKVADEFHKELVFHDFSKLEAYIRDELKLPLCSGSYATYIKVFPDRIFQDADRLLFMDGDTIINGSIKPLLDMDLEPYVFAATKVSLINEKHVYKQDPQPLRLQYALMFQDTGYYNIGVFYANLKRWKEVDFGSQIMAMRELHLERMSQAPDVPIDEMLINLAALEHLEDNYVLPVPAIYNSTVHNIPHYRGLKANLCCGYINKKEFDEAYYHPVIIHYCIFKPWYVDTFSPYRRVLKKYIAESPWPDAFEDTLYKTFPEKVFGKLVYSMPSEPLMTFTIRCGHFALRTRGRFINFGRRISAKWQQFKTRVSRKRTALEQAKTERAEAKAERVVTKKGGFPLIYRMPHGIRAVVRRGKCLFSGDWKTAFAWPTEYISARKKKKAEAQKEHQGYHNEDSGRPVLK